MPKREFDLRDLNGINGFTINGVAAGDRAGVSVASAGDINRDGFGDIIIGAHRASPAGKSLAGANYLIFGHDGAWPDIFLLSSLNGSNGFLLEGANNGDGSGYSVSSAADVNADGIDDLIIGSRFADPGARLDAGEAYVVFGSISSWPANFSLSALNGSNGFVMEGVREGDWAGRSVSMAGDINQDGIDDVIVGARFAGADDAGASYIVLGHAGNWSSVIALSSLNGSNGFVIPGINPSDSSGFLVAGVGDINGDQIDDFMISSPSAASGAGETYVIFGHYGNWPSEFALSSLNGSNGFLLRGVDPVDTSGWFISRAGDVNGDGFSDIIIGAPYAVVSGYSSTGESYVVFGHSGVWPAVLSLDSLNGSNGFMLQGIAIGDVSGKSVSTAGDLNGDGFADIVIGAQAAHSSGRIASGESYIIFGHGGIWPSVIPLSSLNGSNGLVLRGAHQDDRSGRSVSAAGDLNGDGFDDVLIGADFADAFDALGAGQAYVIFGGPEQFIANQILIRSGEMIRLTQDNIAVEPIIGNRTFTLINTSHIDFVSTYNTARAISNFTQQQIIDGEILVVHDGSRNVPSYILSAEGIIRVFSDVHPQQGNVSFSLGPVKNNAPQYQFDLSNLNGVNGFVIKGFSASSQSGFSVASAGDVNGDGANDIIIGAPHAGQSYLVFGHNGRWPENFTLSSLNGSNGVVLNPSFQTGSGAHGDLSGHSVSHAGDFNADGIDDVIIGAIFADPVGRYNAGQTYILFGRRGYWPALVNLYLLNETTGIFLNGISQNDYSASPVSALGDVNGDGVSDIIIGSQQASPANRTIAGQCYLIFGHNASWPLALELSSLDAGVGVTFNGVSSASRSPAHVALAGDVNGDGFNDIVIGARQVSVLGEDNVGQAYIVFGGVETWPSAIELSSLNGTTGIIINGAVPEGYFGTSVSGVGDINADGLDDLIVTASRANTRLLSEGSGRIYILFGHQSDWSSGINLASLNGQNGTIVNGLDETSYRNLQVASAGDLNADGINDLVIGVTSANKVYVIFGHSGVWPAVVDLSQLDVNIGTIITSAVGGGLGWSVSFAGDINTDGYEDLIIGAPFYDQPRDRFGQTYLIFGGSEQFNVNEIQVRQGEILRLNASNIAVEPNIESRTINVTNVEHARFALNANQTIAINTFTQGQINNGEIVFIHDGSDQAPSYVASAQGITRVFSNVHPLAGNVSFILSTSTLTTVSTLISTNTETSATETSTSVSTSSTVSTVTDVSSITATTTTPTTSSISSTSQTLTTPFFTLSSSLFSTSVASNTLAKTTSTWLSLLTTHLPLTTDLNAGTKNTDLNTEDAASNSLGIAVGILSSLLVLALLWILHSRHKNQKNNQLQNIANAVRLNGREHGTVEMMMNPMHVQSEALVTREGYLNKQSDLATGYLDVAGANSPSPDESTTDGVLTAGEYVEPVSMSDSTILSGQLHTYLSPVSLREGEKEQLSSVTLEGYEVPISGGRGEDHCYSKFSDSSNTDTENLSSNVYRLFKNESVKQNTQQQYSMNKK